MYTHIGTELEAVNISLDLWAFLKSTGKDKNDYLRDFEEKYLSGCALCQFHLHQNANDKEKQDKDGKFYRSGCIKCALGKKTLCRFSQKGSVYNKWSHTPPHSHPDVELRKAYAEVIYAAILKRKKKLEASDVG